MFNIRKTAASSILVKEQNGTLFKPGVLDRLMKDIPETCQDDMADGYMNTLDQRIQKEEMPQFSG